MSSIQKTHVVKSFCSHRTTCLFLFPLGLETTWFLYPDPRFSGRAGFRNLDPSDGGWFLNPMLTVFLIHSLKKSEGNWMEKALQGAECLTYYFLTIKLFKFF